MNDYYEVLEDVSDLVDAAERAVNRALRVIEDATADEVLDEVYFKLKDVQREIRRLKIAISDAREVVE